MILWVGPLLDCSTVFLTLSTINLTFAITIFAAGFPANLIQAVCTALALLFLGRPFLDRLERVKMKYGILE